MKNTPKTISAIALVIIAVVLKTAFSNIFNFIPLFMLKWPVFISVILGIIFACSTIRFSGHKIDKFFKSLFVISIPLNIIIWIIALIAFKNGNIDCNTTLFYILFAINAFRSITKIPEIFEKDEENHKNQ